MWKYLLGGAAALVALVLAANWPTDQEAAAYAHRDLVASECDRMMSDASLGNERRATREACDQLKARAQAEVEAARKAKP